MTASGRRRRRNGDKRRAPTVKWDLLVFFLVSLSLVFSFSFLFRFCKTKGFNRRRTLNATQIHRDSHPNLDAITDASALGTLFFNISGVASKEGQMVQLICSSSDATLWTSEKLWYSWCIIYGIRNTLIQEVKYSYR